MSDIKVVSLNSQKEKNFKLNDFLVEFAKWETDDKTEFFYRCKECGSAFTFNKSKYEFSTKVFEKFVRQIGLIGKGVSR